MSTSELVAPAPAQRYPLGAWALALAFVGPVVTMAIAAIVFAAIFGSAGFGGFAISLFVTTVLLGIVAVAAICLAVASLARRERPGRAAALIALVLATTGLALLVFLTWIPWGAAL